VLKIQPRKLAKILKIKDRASLQMAPNNLNFSIAPTAPTALSSSILLARIQSLSARFQQQLRVKSTVAVGMEAIAAAFGSGKSLYEIMGVQTTATEAQIKKAYFKLALTCVSAHAIYNKR
jgi:DnaJ domain